MIAVVVACSSWVSVGPRRRLKKRSSSTRASVSVATVRQFYFAANYKEVTIAVTKGHVWEVDTAAGLLLAGVYTDNEWQILDGKDGLDQRLQRRIVTLKWSLRLPLVLFALRFGPPNKGAT
jgi:hypothetical protein